MTQFNHSKENSYVLKTEQEMSSWKEWFSTEFLHIIYSICKSD